jgi:hypothetical protein
VAQRLEWTRTTGAGLALRVRGWGGRDGTQMMKIVVCSSWDDL